MFWQDLLLDNNKYTCFKLEISIYPTIVYRVVLYGWYDQREMLGEASKGPASPRGAVASGTSSRANTLEICVFARVIMRSCKSELSDLPESDDAEDSGRGGRNAAE